MPHLTLEYTDNITQEIDFQGLFAQLHQILADVAGIPIANCKSRAICLSEYRITDGRPEHAFAHLMIRFLEGRAVNLKREIGTQSVEALRAAFEPSFGPFEMQVSAEIQDIERQMYHKYP